jgi:hypothetical protein
MLGRAFGSCSEDEFESLSNLRQANRSSWVSVIHIMDLSFRFAYNPDDDFVDDEGSTGAFHV